MPTIEENFRAWNQDHRWSSTDDDWSTMWGNCEAQWWGTLFPRLHAFLPCEHLLEIAPGYGRWTNLLRRHCQRLTAVDLSERCVEHCRQRFKDDPAMTFIVNDGRSLGGVDDRSVDFAFSFDSLVHAEADVIEAYIDQLSRKLTPNGVAFIHHSNAYRYRRRFAPGRLVPLPWRSRLMRYRLLPKDHMRASTMSAERFAELCLRSGCRCISQELINWGYLRDLDCLSIFTPKGSRWDRDLRRVSNPYFLAEARSIKCASALYNNRPAAAGPA
jgi:2-polyprenyl-3-methyl-5-hydroxy-6-metoxy-1,4-benzoquinol methylase